MGVKMIGGQIVLSMVVSCQMTCRMPIPDIFACCSCHKQPLQPSKARPRPADPGGHNGQNQRLSLESLLILTSQQLTVAAGPIEVASQDSFFRLFPMPFSFCLSLAEKRPSHDDDLL